MGEGLWPEQPRERSNLPTVLARARQRLVAVVAVVARAVAGAIVFAPSNPAPNAREVRVARATPLVAPVGGETSERNP